MIRQPSYETFGMFDRLLLLQKGGWVVYKSDTRPWPEQRSHPAINTARQMADYLSSCSSAVRPLVHSKNPAKYMLNATVGKGMAVDSRAEQNGVDFVECWARSAMAVAVHEAIDSAPLGKKLHLPTLCSASCLQEIAPDIRRWLQSHWRDAACTGGRSKTDCIWRG